MRKKIIALVLGLVLALSLYLPAGAAAQVSEDTVVQVVTAIGILNGDGSGDLNLSGNVTRAEFATMLVRASSLKDSTAAVSNVSPFKDVSYTHWAASYVKTAVQQGWMSGYLDGTYRPDQPITLEEAETAVLKMLGYTNSDFPGAFPYGQVSLAQSLKLDENVNAQMGENLTRRDCMYLMYNLMNTKNKEGVLYCTTLGYEADANEEISVTSIINDSMTGPIIAAGNGDVSSVPFTPTAVYRNGVKTEVSAIQQYDVLYYSTTMNTVWAYDNKVSGTYEKAEPNSDYPTSVTVSGTSYEIGNSTAAYQLSAVGTFHVGDTLTLLLDKDGKVAAAVDAVQAGGDTIGVVTEKGTKDYVDSNGNGYTASYVRVASLDGSVYDYKLSNNISTSVGAVVKVTVSGGNATVSRLSTKSLSGSVNAANRTIGSYKVASNVKIMDTGDDSYAWVNLDRIDGLNLSGDKVYYYETNGAGEITSLILKEVTGDTGVYGMVMEASRSTDSDGYTTQTFTCETTSGNMTYSASGTGLTTGPAKFQMDGSQLQWVSNLKVLSGITSVNSMYVKTDSANYRMADDVMVYIRDGVDYYRSTLSQLITNGTEYDITAYYDKAESEGGRIRIIIADID